MIRFLGDVVEGKGGNKIMEMWKVNNVKDGNKRNNQVNKRESQVVNHDRKIS